MQEEDLVTPEWVKNNVLFWSFAGIYDGSVGCARCGKRPECTDDVAHHACGPFALHRTDPAVNLQPGQTVEEVRRGYVQREDGSWGVKGVLVEFDRKADAITWADGVLTGEPTVSWPLLCHCGGSFSTEERYDSRRCGSCGAVYSLERCIGLGRAVTKPEPPPEYTCAPGCDPANPCMSEEEYEKLAKRIDADLSIERPRNHVCRARHHLVVEAALAKLSAAEGVADPVAKVKSPPIPGVRWNGRASR